MLELYGENSKTGEINILDVVKPKNPDEMIEVWMQNSITDTSAYDSFFITNDDGLHIPFTRETAKEKYGEPHVKKEEGVLVIPIS